MWKIRGEISEERTVNASRGGVRRQAVKKKVKRRDSFLRFTFFFDSSLLSTQARIDKSCLPELLQYDGKEYNVKYNNPYYT